MLVVFTLENEEALGEVGALSFNFVRCHRHLVESRVVSQYHRIQSYDVAAYVYF